MSVISSLQLYFLPILCTQSPFLCQSPTAAKRLQ